jgi:hypothetical protein
MTNAPEQPNFRHQSTGGLNVGGRAPVKVHYVITGKRISWFGFWIGLLIAVIAGFGGGFIAWPSMAWNVVCSIALSTVFYLVGCYLLPPNVIKEVQDTTRETT